MKFQTRVVVLSDAEEDTGRGTAEGICRDSRALDGLPGHFQEQALGVMPKKDGSKRSTLEMNPPSRAEIFPARPESGS